MRRNRGPFENDDALFAPIGSHPADGAPMPRMNDDADAPDKEYAQRRIPSSEIDRYFDDEMSADESRGLFERLLKRPDRAQEVVWTQRAIDALREPVTSPNVVPAVLREVGRRKSWLAPMARLRVLGTRYAAGIAILLVLGGAFALQRFAPEAASVTPREAPIASIVEAGAETAQAVEELPCSFEVFCSQFRRPCDADACDGMPRNAAPAMMAAFHPEDAESCDHGVADESPLRHREVAVLAIRASEPLVLSEAARRGERTRASSAPSILAGWGASEVSSDGRGPRSVFASSTILPASSVSSGAVLDTNPFEDRR